MKYLISYWNGKCVENRIVHNDNVQDIQGAIQDHEDNYGLGYYPIINVWELGDNFKTEIYDDDYE